jgi:glycosyltransferase involved in cell wall biosynthesis
VSKNLCLNLPVNSVSFGQVSTLILREFYKKNLDFNLCPIGNAIDLSTQDVDQNFFEWIKNKTDGFLHKIQKNDNCFKLWHLNGSLESYCCEQNLFSFYELDNPTKEEINIAKNQKNLILSSNYACNLFRNLGCNNVKYMPLGFDKYSFKTIDRKYFNDDRIVFNVVGKLEKRKHHKKIIQTWLKKYGNQKNYHLQCAVDNPFLKEEDNKTLLVSILEGKSYFNISFLANMQKNSMYNDFLNSANIIIGMSGGEGWGIPEFNSIALGKYGVILNAHSYKDWANKDNAILVEPNGKIEAYDNMFFHRGSVYNQGNIFDFNPDDFISACEIAIEKVRLNKVNSQGLKLQEDFNSEKFADSILNIVNA